MFKCSSVQVFRCSDVLKNKCSNVQMFKCQMSIRLNFCRSVPTEFFSVIFGVLKNQPAIQGKLRKHYLCKQSVSLGWVMSLGHSPIQRDKLTNTQVAKTLLYKTRFSMTCRKAGDSDHREQEGSRVCCKRRGCSGSPPP